MSEGYKLSSWNRPTLGWKLECEGNVDKSRFEGYTAAGTDLEIDKSVYSYRKIGWTFVIVMGLGLAGQCYVTFLIDEPQLNILVNIAVNVIFMITMPVIYARLKATAESNR